MRTLGCHAIVVIKGKVRPVTCHEGSGGGGVEVYLYPFFTSALEEGGWSTPHTKRFYPCERALVTIVQVAGWDPGPVWTLIEKIEPLTTTGFRTPDCAACNDLSSSSSS